MLPLGYGLARIISCCRRSFVGPGGLLRMTVLAKVWGMGFREVVRRPLLDDSAGEGVGDAFRIGCCKPCHSKRCEESPLFSIRRGVEAFVRPFARTHRQHRCGADRNVRPTFTSAGSSASFLSAGSPEVRGKRQKVFEIHVAVTIEISQQTTLIRSISRFHFR